MPQPTLDTSTGVGQEGKNTLLEHLELSTSPFGELGEESLRSGRGRINMGIAHLESCKAAILAISSIPAVPTPSLTRNRQKGDFYFHQQLHSWVECQRVVLTCWRAAVLLNSIL